MARVRLLRISHPWRWVAGGIFAIVLVAAFLGWVLLPGIVAGKLSALLKTPVSITELAVSPFGDSLVARGITVAQPEGFGGEPILHVGTLSIDGWRDALSGPRELGDVHFEDLRFRFISREDGPSNLSSLWQAMRSDDDPDTTQSPGDPFTLLIRRATFGSVSVIVRNEFADEEPHELEFQGDDVRIDRFTWGPVGGVEPGEIELNGGLIQPDFARAELFVGGRFAGVGTGETALRVATRVTGGLFQTLVPVVPKNTETILGGGGFDTDVETKLAGGSIDLEGTIRTSGKTSYDFAVKGPVGAPQTELPDKLQSVASRMRGSAGRVVRSTLGGGAELAKGTAQAAGDLGKGALSTVGSALKGAGKAVMGVLSADKDKAGEGVSSMTVGAGSEAKEALGKSGERITGAGEGTTDALVHDPRLENWMKEIPKRHAERTAGLMDSLRKDSFPPNPED